MKYNVLFFFNLILFSMIFDFGKSMDLPDFIHVCKRNDPNIVTCVIESVTFLKPYLQKGVPEYNIPSLEPLLLKNLISTERGGLRINANDVEAYGASDFTITDLKINLDNLEFAFHIKLPNLYIKANYDINGRILLLPVQGSGPMTGNFSRCTGTCKIRTGRKQLSNGETNIFIEDFQMKITVGKGILNLENLFGGEKTIGDVINKAINSNFDAFLVEIQPIIETGLSNAFRDLTNSIINNFSYEQLFPLD